MKERFVRVTVVTVIISLFYFFFIRNNEIPKEKQESIEVKTDTLLNKKGYLIIGKPNTVKLITISDTINYKGFSIIETYKEDVFIAKKEDKDNLEIYKKFSIASAFEEYQVPLYRGELAAPNFNSNSEAKMFKTRIMNGCKEGINFAGYYTLIYWGCGTSCQYGIIVNRKTGKIIDGYQSTLGSEFKKDSKFIIMDSDFLEGEPEYIPLYQFKKFAFKLWDENRFVEIN